MAHAQGVGLCTYVMYTCHNATLLISMQQCSVTTIDSTGAYHNSENYVDTVQGTIFSTAIKFTNNITVKLYHNWLVSECALNRSYIIYIYTVQHKTLVELELQENWQRKQVVGRDKAHSIFELTRCHNFSADKTDGLAINRQMHQSFLPSKFCTIRYYIF